jgi:RHS repeat-associated protein
VGNRTSLTVASGTTSYTFDELNRLETVTDPDGGVTAYTYDAVGNRASVTYPNGTVAEYTYDALNRLTYLENRKSSGEVISSYAYTLGPAGNRVQVVENNGRTVDYTYDGLYRLVQEDISDAANGAETIAYTYDAFGNRLTKTDGSGTIVYAYDANDRLISETGPAGAYTYAYDANGNTLEKSDGADSIYYTYDSENRLIQVDDGTSITAYTYDADGSRVASDTDGVDTVFVVDKNRQYAQVLEERDGAGSLTVSYVYGDDLISQHRGGSISYYHYDGQLSTRTLTNAAGDITDTYDYDAFGNLRDQVGTTENNYRYTGEQFDPNAGFYYLRARYYDQAMGRFVATDPYQGRMHEPVTLHKYLYANANPVMFNDPSGKFAGSIGSSMTALSIMALMIAATHVAIQTIENAIKYFDIKFVKFPGLRDNNPELYYKLKKIYNELLKKRNN